jgi:hypothetical protein
MGTTRCPETSVNDYHSTLRNIPEERRPEVSKRNYSTKIPALSLIVQNFKGLWLVYVTSPIPVAVRSNAWVYGRSPTGIVGSNPTGGIDVCLLLVLCVVR